MNDDITDMIKQDAARAAFEAEFPDCPVVPIEWYTTGKLADPTAGRPSKTGGGCRREDRALEVRFIHKRTRQFVGVVRQYLNHQVRTVDHVCLAWDSNILREVDAQAAAAERALAGIACWFMRRAERSA
jgi:hypothetical protein